MAAPGFESQRAFWDFKAASGYPEADVDPDPLAEVLCELEAQGLSIATAEILEVGSGTGRYTLPLASATRGRVVAVDLAPAMLSRMEASARARGLSRIEAVCAPWESIDHESRGWKRAFDLVFAAMTPAVNSVEGLAAFRSCSRGWCAVVGWGRYRRNPLWEEIYGELGVALIVPPGLPVLRERLAEQGVESEPRWQHDQWTWRGTVEDALEDVLWNLRLGGHLESNDPGDAPLRRRIEKVLLAHARNGEVHHETQMERGWIVWREPCAA